MIARKKYRSILVASILLSICLGNPLFSQETDENSEQAAVETVTDLDKVVVTATKTSEKRKDVPVNVEIITKEQIAATNADSVGDVIGYTTTGHYHRYNGLSQSIGMRGFRSDSHGDDIKGEVLVLVDGHRIGTGNMAKIPPEIIERIEIIKGPASALYGSAAMGGVVNIITKKGEGDITTDVSATYGSYDYTRLSASSGGSLSDWAQYFIAVSHVDVDNYETSNYGEAYNTGRTETHCNGNFTFFPSADQEVRLGFSYADLEVESPSWLNGLDHTEYDPNAENYSDKDRGHIDLEYNQMFMENRVHWKGVGYYLYDLYQWYSGDSSSGYDVEDSYSRFVDTTWGTDQQVTIKLVPQNTIVAGYTCELLEKESSAKTNGVDSRPYAPNLEYRTNSVYLQDSIDLFHKRVQIVLGGRYDHFAMETKKPETGEYDSFVEKEETYQHVSPRGGVVVKLADFMRVRGNIGHAFQSPSADQLSAQYEHGTTRWLGNPDLEPQTSTTYETGFDLYSSFGSFGTTYSFTRSKNMIVTSDEKVQYDGKEWTTYENKGKTEVQAIDWYLSCALDKLVPLPIGVELSTNMTYNIKYEDLDAEDGEEKELNYISDFEAKTQLVFSYKQALLAFTHVYVGSQNIQVWDASWNEYVEEKDPFYVLNVHCSWQMVSYLKLTAAVNNLTDKNYEWVRGYPMPGRNYRIGLTGTF